jgi:two-component system chemotaxis response regulator CheY
MPKILIVDDSMFLRYRCAKLLREQGFDVVEAATGDEAIDVYQRERPAAVLMDITMPRMDGLEALERIRAIDPNARVVMLTAMGQPAIVRQAIRGGARDVVVKPFHPDRLLSAVERLIA